jgi:hypothetical protein
MPDIGKFITEHWRNAIEILILALGVYQIFRAFRSTRGARILVGLVSILVVLTLISRLFAFEVIGWIITRAAAALALALIVIFQPELRNALAKWKEAELNAGFCAWCFHVAHAAASGTTPAVLRELRRLSDTHVQSSRLRRGWSWLHARVMAKDALRSEMAARRRAAMSRHQAANFLWRTQAIGAVFCALTVLSERAKRQAQKTQVALSAGQARSRKEASSVAR